MQLIGDDFSIPSGRDRLVSFFREPTFTFRLSIFFVVYLLGAWLARIFALIPDTGISIWAPSGLFLATLTLVSFRNWHWWVLAAFAAEMFANQIWFKNPFVVAALINLGNALEAIFGASLIKYFSHNRYRFESLRDVIFMLLLGAGLAPVMSATVGSMTLAWFENKPLMRSWGLWWIGDATGVLIVAPLAWVVIQNFQQPIRLTLSKLLEVAVLTLVFLGIAALSLSGYLPFAYIIMPPLLWAAVRFEFSGAVASMVVLTFMTAVFTVSGVSQFAGDFETQQYKPIMLQLFLAISATTALVVAAISRQYRVAMESLRRTNDDLEQRVELRSKKLQESEERLRLFIENAPAGIAQFDQEMRYIVASHRWIKDYGLPNDFIGKCHYDLIPDLPGGMREAYVRSLAGEVMKSEGQQFKRRDGSTLWLQWETLPWRTLGGKIGGILIASENITERKIAEQLLRDEDRRKDEFLATLAHELRNPLAPLRNAAQILQMNGAESPEMVWAQEVIDRQVRVMTRLIDDLLDISRINQGKIELRKELIKFDDVLSGAIETSRPLIEEMGHELKVQLPNKPIVLEGDLTRLSQVFQNLLNNAAKYMDRGGLIEIQAELENQNVVVSIKDRGIGIPEDKIGSIFEMFSQIEDAISRSQGGLGIGLSLVKRLVEMHGGLVHARSEGSGKGATFIVQLPVAQSSMPIEEKEVVITPSITSSELRMLVVDDNADAATTLAMLLQFSGHDVRRGNDGEEAIQIAAEFLPDVVLCDIGLPLRNGYEVARYIRNQSWGKEMILVAITGWGKDGDIRLAQEAGFDHHLVKPVAPELLNHLISSFSSRPQQLSNHAIYDMSSKSNSNVLN